MTKNPTIRLLPLAIVAGAISLSGWASAERHSYTTSWQEFNALRAEGYEPTGVVGSVWVFLADPDPATSAQDIMAPPSGAVPLVRLRHPLHHRWILRAGAGQVVSAQDSGWIIDRELGFVMPCSRPPINPQLVQLTYLGDDETREHDAVYIASIGRANAL